MLELKVQCDCGQKIKFDVEPVNNRMPFTLICPICGADGTEKANALLQSAPSAFPPAPAPSTSYGIPPSTPLLPTVPVATEKPRLRINTGGSHTAPPASSADREQETSPVDAAIAATAGKPVSRFPVAPSATMPKKTYKDPEAFNLPMGILGAVIGGAVGMAGWYYLTKATDMQIGYAAWGVGVLAGFGGRILGRSGEAVLGMISAVCAALAILGAQYLLVHNEYNKLVNEAANESYEEYAEAAKGAAIANTDEEIKALYVKIEMNDNPTADELKAFKETELPKLKNFTNDEALKKDIIEKSRKFMETQLATMSVTRWSVFKMTVKPMTYLFLALGVASAYKIGAG